MTLEQWRALSEAVGVAAHSYGKAHPCKKFGSMTVLELMIWILKEQTCAEEIEKIDNPEPPPRKECIQ